jgi:MFS family permease
VGIRAAVRVRDFRALLLSYAINRTGDELGIFALAIVVFDRTGSAFATAALFIATQFGPGLLGPLLVARIDRAPLGRVLPGIYALETTLFAVLAVIAPHGSVEAVVAIAFVDATLAFTARVLTRAGAASTLADRGLIAEGKAAFNMVFAVGVTAGPALAAVLVANGGARTALALDSGSFLVAALVALGTRRLASATPLPEAERSSAWHQVRAGFRYLADNRALRGLVSAEGVAFVFFYFPIPVIVIYAKQTLHAGSGGYGAIMTAWGIGILLGSLVQARVARRARPALIVASTAAVAAGYLGTAAAPSLAVACGASVIGGVGNGTQWAAVETVVHGLVAEAFRARVTATLETLMTIAPGVGILAGGALAAGWSPRGAYYVAGGGLCVLLLGTALTGRSLFGAADALDTSTLTGPSPSGARSGLPGAVSPTDAVVVAETVAAGLDLAPRPPSETPPSGPRRRASS